ncbi:MAG: PKD domain-containing protein [Planctomycetota bacterium]
MKNPLPQRTWIPLVVVALIFAACQKEETAPPPPVADFCCDVQAGFSPLEVRFRDDSVAPGGITSWAWDFGDGGTSSIQHPVHTFAGGGTYTVSLTVTSPSGTDTCVQSDFILVEFLTADFTTDRNNGPAPLHVQFSDQSSSSGAIDSWAWDFGDGTTSTDSNPAHTYGAVGTYTVSLAVTSSGHTDTCVKAHCIQVQPEPLDAEFSGNPLSGTAPLQVQFTDLTSTSGTITAWAWNFGDGNSASVQDPAHTYTAAGTYTVSLTVTTATGNDTETKTGYIVVSAATTGKPTNGSGGSPGNQTGTYNGRTYKLWVPSTYSDSNPSPIVVCMHGLGDTYTNFYNVACSIGWRTSADNRNYILMVPDHKNASRPSFLHFSGTSFDMNATVAEMNDLLNCIYYGVGANYNIETTEIYWTGFSEGGTFTALAAYVLSRELHACAPYAGCVSGKQFPLPRQIPVYSVCGTQDSAYSQIVAAFQEWVNAGHPTNSRWISGVGHSFIGLCTSGPSPDAVYQWMSTVACQPVISGLP